MTRTETEAAVAAPVPSDDVVVHLDGVVKRYGELTAVAGISFQVLQGEIFGLLGPNGAGKTTTLEMIEGMRRPNAGIIEVAGIDVVRHPRRARRLMGIQLQDAGFLDHTTVRETLMLFAGLHNVPLDIAGLLAEVSLEEKARALVTTLSGGQRQRLSLALALVNDPVLLFLDEPTTGLDPQARRHLWDLIRRQQAEHRTIVLTTHYMEEAQLLCDRVGIIDHGEIIALDTPDALIREHAPHYRVTFRSDGLSESQLAALPGLAAAPEQNEERWVLRTGAPEQLLERLFAVGNGSDAHIADLRLEQGTLEDVFLQLTGRRLRD